MVTPTKLPRWKRISAERYQEMRDILPPIDIAGSDRFLVSEPMSHRRCRRLDFDFVCAAYQAFAWIGNEHFECCEPLTRSELRALEVAEILENVDA